MEPIVDDPVWLADRPIVPIMLLVAFVTLLLTALVCMVFSDASMRHFVSECTGDGGHVEVVQRQIVCLGGRP